MPLYQYKCRKCKAVHEELQTMKEMEDAPITDCVNLECGGKLDKLISETHIGLCDTSLLRDARKSVERLDDKDDIRLSERRRRKAEAAGVSTTGKWYDPQLAIEVDDPGAWVGSISDIRDRCKQMGWDFKYEDGNIKVTQHYGLHKTVKEQATEYQQAQEAKS